MSPLAPIEAWFSRQGWTPMAFQRECWQSYLAGESGLLQVPTGSGKTYAAVMGPIAELLAERRTATQAPGRLHLLVITPLRALSRDLALAIKEPIQAMGWPLRVGIRNGDTSSHERTKQLRTPPEILITTPESLSVLLANPRAPPLFAGLQAVVLDEWHELMGSKRGSSASSAWAGCAGCNRPCAPGRSVPPSATSRRPPRPPLASGSQPAHPHASSPQPCSATPPSAACCRRRLTASHGVATWGCACMSSWWPDWIRP